MSVFLQAAFSGLVNGTVFALIGLGLVLCYRSSRVVNLAQGETYMGSGMLISKLALVGFPIIAAASAGLALAVVASLALERFVLRSRLRWPAQRLIIVAVGVALFAEGVADLVVGADQYSFPPLLKGPAIILAGAGLDRQGLLVIVLGLSLALVLSWFFRMTVIGQAMSACAERPTTASLLGIPVSRMRTLSYGLAGLLGGIAALLLVPLAPITYNVGLALTLSGYVAAAVGEMRRPEVTFLAGLAVGLTEAFLGAYVNQLLAEPLVLGVFLIVGVSFLARGIRFGGVVRA